jgi:hypothetical protein
MTKTGIPSKRPLTFMHLPLEQQIAKIAMQRLISILAIIFVRGVQFPPLTPA